MKTESNSLTIVHTLITYFLFLTILFISPTVRFLSSVAIFKNK